MTNEAKNNEIMQNQDHGACPICGSNNVNCEIKDKAFSVHYIDDKAVYTCNSCGHSWEEQYGYKGLA